MILTRRANRSVRNLRAYEYSAIRPHIRRKQWLRSAEKPLGKNYRKIHEFNSCALLILALDLKAYSNQIYEFDNNCQTAFSAVNAINAVPICYTMLHCSTCTIAHNVM